MQNTQNDNEDAFDEVFASETNTTEVVVPEPVGGKTGKPEKRKAAGKTSLVRYIVYGVSGLVALFVILIIFIIALPSDDSAKAPALPIIEVPEQVAEPAAEQPVDTASSDEPTQTSMVLENNDLKGLLDTARQAIEIRDNKYKELLEKYKIAVSENTVLKGEIQLLRDGGAASYPSKSKGMKVMKGISIITIQDGYAFIQKAKGSSVYSVTVGEKINGAQVKEIDPINREIITTSGVIR
ncbi:hypothetical protein RDB90_005203 [Salmonella enterica]|uniref:TraP-like protein n=1 Tax=Salmonella enterica TaxID=28901 RepID=A0A759MBX3_SALER|nr:hypothetical protein [Salmonella enterica subsp. enterica serovar Montevideo]EBU2832477.1 hypothetical protein [Salmonella enterica]ECY7784975.1 hypothetical protein [Salmonella enterica subsp. enterica serovar Anatum]EDR9713716.1 hypothetical protein [Salmonella enterica subsp. diarizonae]MJZ70845.1 hypothetical protein [Salmonella enterica subsp. enterica]